MRGLYPATKQQGYGRGKQGGCSRGRAELLVQERETGRESNGLPAITDRDAGEAQPGKNGATGAARGMQCHRKAGLRGGR